MEKGTVAMKRLIMMLSISFLFGGFLYASAAGSVDWRVYEDQKNLQMRLISHKAFLDLATAKYIPDDKSINNQELAQSFRRFMEGPEKTQSLVQIDIEKTMKILTKISKDGIADRFLSWIFSKNLSDQKVVDILGIVVNDPNRKRSSSIESSRNFSTDMLMMITKSADSCEFKSVELKSGFLYESGQGDSATHFLTQQLYSKFSPCFQKYLEYIYDVIPVEPLFPYSIPKEDHVKTVREYVQALWIPNLERDGTRQFYEALTAHNSQLTEIERGKYTGTIEAGKLDPKNFWKPFISFPGWESGGNLATDESVMISQDNSLFKSIKKIETQYPSLEAIKQLPDIVLRSISPITVAQQKLDELEKSEASETISKQKEGFRKIIKEKSCQLQISKDQGQLDSVSVSGGIMYGFLKNIQSLQEQSKSDLEFVQGLISLADHIGSLKGAIQKCDVSYSGAYKHLYRRWCSEQKGIAHLLSPSGIDKIRDSIASCGKDSSAELIYRVASQKKPCSVCRVAFDLLQKHLSKELDVDFQIQISYDEDFDSSSEVDQFLPHNKSIFCLPIRSTTQSVVVGDFEEDPELIKLYAKEGFLSPEKAGSREQASPTSITDPSLWDKFSPVGASTSKLSFFMGNESL